VGRKKGIIIRGGQNISPKEIEDILMLMAKIAEVAVIGLPDPVYGERACACVLPKDSKDIVTLEEVTSFLRGKGLAPFKLPERLEIVKSLPRSAGEKIRKDLLAREI
jgi:cyclohexanecarboxylate-CoA ligase